MKADLFPRSVTALLLFCLLTSATACSDSDGKEAAETPHGTKLIPLKRACGGKVFDQQAYKEITSSRRGGTLRDGVQAEGVKYSATQEASRLLGAEVDSSSPARMTCFVDDAKGGNAELEIQFGWWPEDFPDKKSEPGTSAVFRSDDSYELLVDCSIGAPPSGQAEPVTLRGTIVDRVGLTSHTAAKILIASAKEVTAGMKCGKAITFPDPPESHEGLK